jgi:hypothetical protein
MSDDTLASRIREVAVELIQKSGVDGIYPSELHKALIEALKSDYNNGVARNELFALWNDREIELGSDQKLRLPKREEEVNDEKARGSLPQATIDALDEAAHKYMERVRLMMSAFSDAELQEYAGEQEMSCDGNDYFNHELYCKYAALVELANRSRFAAARTSPSFDTAQVFCCTHNCDMEICKCLSEDDDER